MFIFGLIMLNDTTQIFILNKTANEKSQMKTDY